MAYVGGIRARLVKDSLFEMLRVSLEDLGWFDPNRQHAPIKFVSEPIAAQDEVPLNTLALSDEDMFTLEDELGSGKVEQHWTFYMDFYGESNAMSIHMTQDLKAILDGRLPSIGRVAPRFTVYDFQKATPQELFQAHIENVEIDRARGWPELWRKHWYAIEFEVVDHYWNENDD